MFLFLIALYSLLKKYFKEGMHFFLMTEDKECVFWPQNPGIVLIKMVYYLYCYMHNTIYINFSNARPIFHFGY